MHALALAVLLALSASADDDQEGLSLVIAILDARPTAVTRPEILDPCARALQIARRPACLDRDDCPALQLWQRAFGVPRIEPAGPDRGLREPLITRMRSARWSLPSIQDTQRLMPGTICAAGADPPS